MSSNDLIGLRRAYRRELKKLDKLSGDFSPEGDLRFINQRRRAIQAFDALYYADSNVIASYEQTLDLVATREVQ